VLEEDKMDGLQTGAKKQDTDKFRQTLEEFLASPDASADSPSLIEMDGYMTAVIIGPELIMPSQWMTDLWPEQFGFKGAKEAQKITSALLEYYNGIIRHFEGPPENYRPLYLPEDPEQPATVERAAEWSQGFWNAITRHPGWRPIIEDKDARRLLVPILVFAKTPNETPLIKYARRQHEEMLEDAVDKIAEFLLLIRQYWQDYNASHDKPAPNHPVRSQCVGRNEPCPCGSGKKYKRCCGSN
jgi:uncharacterized protein